ncbi:hypothetical protein J6TS1_27330 [Siminovitchia terrae]|uniref:Uncharacterized protein n=1 Tax=Siminovitchia terrae TaxID=1914933 RepID=A0ABQ4KXV3_SIMTE|nr:hypothetical protein J6TS1_27330 [Siminovitchia terrae]
MDCASINHVEVISVEILFPMAIPATVTIGLRVLSNMLASRYTLGATIKSGLASDVGCGDDERAATGNIQLFYISEQS